MQPFLPVTSIAVPLGTVNVSTDQLIPARFMSRTRAQGYGPYLLHDIRFDAEGQKRPDCILNDPLYQGAAILVAGRNFGTGSSREAAVYALWDAGFRCVIAPSFGDIFAANAIKNGLLPARVAVGEADQLMAFLLAHPGAVVTVRLEEQDILWPEGVARFDIAAGAKQQLLSGLDDIGLTLRHGAAIDAFAAADGTRRPWAQPRSPDP
jgi:3-isopropylmalate/(R)-2-methylmalate dehydratase small subunit